MLERSRQCLVEVNKDNVVLDRPLFQEGFGLPEAKHGKDYY